MRLSRIVVGALKAGATEMRLVPGYPPVVVVKGKDAALGRKKYDSAAIEGLVDGILTAQAQMDLSLGEATWDVKIPDVGILPVSARMKNGKLRATFALSQVREPTAEDGAEFAEDITDDIELLPTEEEAVAVTLNSDDGVVEIEPEESASPAIGPEPSGGATQLAKAKAARQAAAQQAAAQQAAAQQAAAQQAAAQQAAAQQAAALAAAQAQLVQQRDALQKAQLQLQQQQQVFQNQQKRARETAAASAAPQGGPVAASAMRSGGSSADIDRLLTILLETKGSDLHICSGVKPMIRVDGDMRALTNQAQLTPEAVQKMLWPIVPPLNREEFTRRRDTDFAYEIPGKARFRANMFVDRRGVGGVFRIIPSDIMTGEDLGIPSEILHRFSTLQKGLVLVTGPTGSGKSTTLNAFVDYINRNRSAHIITIEDPIEFVHENRRCLINQRQVGQHTDSFKDALRAALREDPDIILVGEIRDLETIEIALETAETGHLVFGTLHTSSAASTVDRIIDQFPADRQSQIRVMLSSSLMGVIAQVLCKKTNGGRVAAYEILIGIPAVSNLIREQKVFQLASVMQTGRKLGMRMMADSLVALVKGGAITPEEAITKAQDRSQLMAAFAAENIEPMSPKSGTKSPRSKKKKGG